MAALQQPVPPPMAALQQPAPKPAPPLDNAKARYRRKGLASQLRALKVARSAERKKELEAMASELKFSAVL